MVTSLFSLFDKDRDLTIHLNDIIGFLTVVSLGDKETQLEQGKKKTFSNRK